MTRMRALVALLALATAAYAGQPYDRNVEAALAVFRGGNAGGELEDARDRMVANFRKAGPRYRTAALRGIGAQFNRKLKRSEEYLEVAAETLARCGNAGLRELKQQWSANKSRPTGRRAIVRGWARSENPKALKYILDPGVWDKNRYVSEAAIKGCANFTQVKVGTRKKTLQKLIERYKRVTDAAAGKPAKSKEARAYALLKPALNETLAVLSGGENFDSALAWAEWFKQFSTKKLPPLGDTPKQG